MSIKNTVVVGSFLGDCGKAKIVDYLAQNANHVVRFNGSGNAGHTVWLNGKKTVFHIVPAGILTPNIVNVISTGVMIDPLSLIDEINDLRNSGHIITPDNLKIASNCSVITSIHRAKDRWEENARGKDKIGTTLRGVGPAAVDKVSRRGMRLYDLKNISNHITREDYAVFMQLYNLSEEYDTFVNKIKSAYDVIAPYLINTSLYLDKACKYGGVLFEGAQSTLLDLEHGMYPYVTSTHCTAGFATVSSGISQMYINEITGVAKAFISRVGSGPLPTQIGGIVEDKFREFAGEFGATTGRPRKLGWLDLVMLKYSARINGLTSLAMTRMDTLGYFDKVKICTHYTIDGCNVEEMPDNHLDLSRAKPNYITLDGWDRNLHNFKEKNKLPKNALLYLDTIEEAVGTHIKYISVGPDRAHIIEA